MGSKHFKLVPEMEGRVAHWYARQRGTQSQMALFRKQAVQVAFMTKFVLATLLRRRVYSPVQFRRVVAESAFRTCEIRKNGIGFEVRLRKSAIEKVA